MKTSTEPVSLFQHYKQVAEVFSKYIPKQQLNDQKNESLLHNAQFRALMEIFPGIISVVDMPAQKYIFMSENIKNYTGYEASEFYELGFQKTASVIHEVHAEIIHFKVLPIMFEHLEHHSHAECMKDLKISFNYLVNHKNGSIGNYLQQTTVLHTDESNKAQIMLMLISDITEIKKDKGVSIIITKKDKDGIFYPLFSQNFLTDSGNDKLSSRELEILNLISQGKSSGEVGDLLCISENTVYKHRKNMLKKMDAKNTGELLSKAIACGMI